MFGRFCMNKNFSNNIAVILMLSMNDIEIGQKMRNTQI